jgi:hypothetical protein
MRILIALVVALLVAATTAAVAAEPPDDQSGPSSPAFAVWERPAIGVSIAATGTGDTPRAADVDATIEAPVLFGWRLRGDASRTTLFFNRLPPGGGAYIREGVDLESFRLAIVGVDHLSEVVTGYAGAGYGAYRYRFAQSPLHNPWRGGAHALAGFEIGTASSPFAVDAEMRLHLANAPGQRPVGASMLLKLDIAAGVKWRF